MLLTARHAERPHLADSGLTEGCAVRTCMPLLGRLRPATCPAGPGGRGESIKATGRLRSRKTGSVCVCLFGISPDLIASARSWTAMSDGCQGVAVHVGQTSRGGPKSIGGQQWVVCRLYMRLGSSVPGSVTSVTKLVISRLKNCASFTDKVTLHASPQAGICCIWSRMGRGGAWTARLPRRGPLAASECCT